MTPPAEATSSAAPRWARWGLPLALGLALLLRPLVGSRSRNAGATSPFLGHGIGIALMAGFPVAFTLAGTSLLFALISSLLGVFDLAFLAAFPQRVFAVMRNDVLIAVPLFIFMGVCLERSGVARRRRGVTRTEGKNRQ